MTAHQTTVFTIGHGAGDFAEMVQRLGAHDVSVIVDVRSIPFSKHAPDFTKDELTHLAAEFNLGYRWLGDRLGGRPDDPALLRDGKPSWEAIARSDAFAAGMTELVGLLEAATVALLCAEVEPAHCHRAHLIAPELERLGYPVMHILSDGSATRHQPTLGLR